MCNDERATYARLPASARFHPQKWTSSSLLHHLPSGVQVLQLRALDFPQICVRWVEEQLRILPPSRLCCMTRPPAMRSRLRSGLLRVSVSGLGCRHPGSNKDFPRSRRQAPEMLALFTHCEHRTEPSSIDADPSAADPVKTSHSCRVCASTGVVRFVRISTGQATSVTRRFTYTHGRRPAQLYSHRPASRLPHHSPSTRRL